MGINLTILKNKYYHRLLYDRWVWIGERLRVHGNDYFSYYKHLQEQLKVLEDSFERLSEETKESLKIQMRKKDEERWWKKYTTKFL